MKNRCVSELAFEACKNVKNGCGFYKKKHRYELGISQTDIKILSSEVSKQLNRDVGNYVTLQIDDVLFYDVRSKEMLVQKAIGVIKNLVKALKKTIKKVLVVGLGNEKYACDSLGKLVTNKILITKPYLDKHLLNPDKIAEIYAISFGVYGTTGIESSRAIKAICGAIKPNLVVAVDSMVASGEHSLCKTIQFSDTKLLPGGGVGNNRLEVSKKVLGCDVIAVGVPLVLNSKTICKNVGELIVTPKDVELKVEALSKIIAKAINLSFCNLSQEEYLQLTS